MDVSDPSIKASPSYHLLSTIVVCSWGLFIILTIGIHEMAHRAMWDPDRLLLYGGYIPWVYRPTSGLPSLLRTIFTQAHGPITAMHVARLAVAALDASWMSPNTWMEVFWLAER